MLTATSRTENKQLQLTLPQANLLADYDTRTLAAIAGTGGGKTALVYWWLLDRMRHQPGYGWGLAEPTYGMLGKIILNSPDPERPSLVEWLQARRVYLGFKAVERIIETTLGKIYLGSADNPDTMQGAALKGYALDEGGMMSLMAYQTAIQRVSFYDGQVLIATTPYNRGWLKTEIVDKADGKYIHVEKWRSIDNPRFPKNVYDEMQATMQAHRFRMMYDAEFERPTGMIYSTFNDETCVVPRFKIPEDWPRYVGMDFGGVNTAVLWYAKSPNGKLYLYREYLAGGKSAKNHAKALQGLSKGEEIARKVGGSSSEGQWRREFNEVGWYVQAPKITDVEVGIDKVVGFHSDDKIKVFSDMKMYLGEKADYRRKLDENMQPTEVIENKQQFHLLDAERYIISSLAGRRPVFEV